MENLERILPIGVTSKNCSGALRILFNNISCKIFAALQQAKNGIKSEKSDVIAVK